MLHLHRNHTTWPKAYKPQLNRHIIFMRYIHNIVPFLLLYEVTWDTGTYDVFRRQAIALPLVSKSIMMFRAWQAVSWGEK